MAKPGWQAGSEFGTPSPRHKASTRPMPGRVCTKLGCTTILSTYNPTSVCWLHTDPSRRPPLSDA